MIKVQKMLVENFLIEKLPGRIYKGNPFIKSSIFSRKLTQGEHQLENPTHIHVLEITRTVKHVKLSG